MSEAVSPLRALLVDDEQDIRTVGRMALETVAGWTVVMAASGAEALERCHDGPFDVVLLDVMMPGMNGPSAMAHLREAGCDAPVVFMTAKVQSHEVEGYRKLGAAGVVSKPFDPMTLAATISAILGSVSADPDA